MGRVCVVPNAKSGPFSLFCACLVFGANICTCDEYVDTCSHVPVCLCASECVFTVLRAAHLSFQVSPALGKALSYNKALLPSEQ